MTSTLASSPQWRALTDQYESIKDVHLRQMFADDPARGQSLSVEGAGLYLDYSKNRVTAETVKSLIELARFLDLQDRIEAMFTGEKINLTEGRAVLHTALRAPRTHRSVVDGQNVIPEVHAVLDKMSAFCDRRARWKLEGAYRQTDSQYRQHWNRRLGSRSGDGVRSTTSFQPREMTFRFVSNVDATDFAEATVDLDPHETLFIVASKTFTTIETMTNADDRARWLLRAVEGDDSRGCQTLHRAVDQRRTSRGVRNRYGQHVRVLGLGRRTLFDGLSHRHVNDAGDRTNQVS